MGRTAQLEQNVMSGGEFQLQLMQVTTQINGIVARNAILDTDTRGSSTILYYVDQKHVDEFMNGTAVFNAFENPRVVLNQRLKVRKDIRVYSATIPTSLYEVYCRRRRRNANGSENGNGKSKNHTNGHAVDTNPLTLRRRKEVTLREERKNQRWKSQENGSRSSFQGQRARSIIH